MTKDPGHGHLHQLHPTITTTKEAGTQVMVTTSISIINVTKDLVEPADMTDIPIPLFS